MKTGKLLSIPYSVDLNDVILHRRGEEVGDFVRQIRDYFDTVYEEGAEQGRVMCIALHPYWVGQPHRIRVFRQALEYILSHPGRLGHHRRRDRRLVQRPPPAGDRGPSRGAGGGQWLSSRTLANTPPTDEARAPGMDHAHYPFRTLPDAPRFAWPDGARIAFTVTLVLDYWELEPPAGTPTPTPASSRRWENSSPTG